MSGRLLRRGWKLARILAHGGHRAALRYGVAASVELGPIPFGEGIRTVIDVGANRGQFAVFAMSRFPAARIHCFEPLPAPASRLELIANALGRGRVRVHRVAIGAVDGRAVMHVMNEDDSSSLLPPGPLQRDLGTVEVGRAAVDIRRLDSAIDPADLLGRTLLKIDVQGAELDVLRGADGLIQAMDEILVECSFVPFYEDQPLAPAVISHLRARGLTVWHTHPSIVAGGRVLQADLLFARRRE